jgi:hypothetical protein
MIIEFKNDVTPDNLKAITFRAVFACAEVLEKHYNLALTITSTDEGVHMPESYHYNGQAFDIRTWRMPRTYLPKVVERLTEALHKIDKQFQVILEPTHIHIELDNGEKA